MSDYAHNETDKIIRETERLLRKEYAKAIRDVQDKLEKFFSIFRKQDKQMQADVIAGIITQKEYQEWRIRRLAIGERWEHMKNILATEYTNANVIAQKIVTGKEMDVYALNYNFATYMIEKETRLDTSFALYNHDAIETLVKKNPDLLPPPRNDLLTKTAQAKDYTWNKQIAQSVIMQGILQGESIDKLARRLAYEMGDSNLKRSIRNARTMMTAAQNAGRLDSYERAEKLGIKLQKTWVAIMDNRTRHEHRILNGQTRPVDLPFEVDGYTIMNPGDPNAPGHLVYNCRCTMVSQIQGFERDVNATRVPGYGNKTYEEWVHEHDNL